MNLKVKDQISKLINNVGFLKYFKNTIWVLFEKILRITIGLFIGIWVVRYLGPNDFGVFSYVSSIVYFFIVISNLGLDGIVVRELIKSTEKENEFIGTAFSLKLIAAIITIFVVGIYLFSSSIFDYRTSILAFIIISAIVFQSFNVIDFYFQSKVLSKYVVYSHILCHLITSLIKIYLILLKAPLIAFGCVVFFEAFVTASGLVYFYYKTGNDFRKWKFDYVIAKYLLKNSWPFIFSGILIAIYMKIDQVMLNFMLGSEAVGIYAAAARLSEMWYFIPVTIASSLFPAIVNAKSISKELYESRLQHLYDLMVILSFTIAILFTFFSSTIVDLLFGGAYAKSAPILSVHIWSGVFVFIGVAGEKWLLNENYQIFFTTYTLVGSFMNIILNYLFISKYGIIGAAWATFIAQFIASYFCQWFFKKTRPNFYRMSKSLLFINSFNFLRNVRK